MWIHSSYFIFNELFYKQIDGVAMGSSLGPTLANAFLCFYEKKWLEHCPEEFKPVYYRLYVDVFLFYSDHKTISLNFVIILTNVILT